MILLLDILGVIAGAASTAQASVNGKIRESFRSPYIVATLGFIAAILFLAAAALITEGDLYLPLGAVAAKPFWIWLGGSCGTAIIILNILCLPKLGSARNVMIICFGQTVSGLAIDHFGLFEVPVVTMTLVRAAGAALVLSGVALVNMNREQPSSEGGKTSERESVLLYMVLATLCGFACAAQVAINGTLKSIAGSVTKTTLISMTSGLITTLIVIVIITMLRGQTGIYDGDEYAGWFRGFRVWMTAGGLLSIIVVAGNAVIAPILGTGISTIMNLIGMMGAGLIIDATGFLGIEKKPVTIIKLAGMTLMIAGTAMISLV